MNIPAKKKKRMSPSFPLRMTEQQTRWVGLWSTPHKSTGEGKQQAPCSDWEGKAHLTPTNIWKEGGDYTQVGRSAISHSQQHRSETSDVAMPPGTAVFSLWWNELTRQHAKFQLHGTLLRGCRGPGRFELCSCSDLPHCWCLNRSN